MTIGWFPHVSPGAFVERLYAVVIDFIVSKRTQEVQVFTVIRFPNRLAVSLLLSALPLGASTLLASNFGPGETYAISTGDAWATGDGGDSGNAVGFTDPNSSYYTLSQIVVADNFFTPSADGGIYNDLNVGLWQSSTDNLNGATELETWAVTTGTLQTAMLFPLTSVLNPVIDPTQFYFITENVTPDPTPGANTATWGWQQNSLTPAQMGYFSNFNGGGWFVETGTTPVFSVSGDLVTSGVPEPRSSALLAAGFAALLILRARHRPVAR
jgi:hypothetical protein